MSIFFCIRFYLTFSCSYFITTSYTTLRYSLLWQLAEIKPFL